jgi:SAM-dependent methyltransferase
MFFRQRSTQAEYFDLPQRAETDVIRSFRDLDRLNRFFMFARPFQETLPRWLGAERCARLEILDVGAGTGLLSRHLSAWARNRGWDWRFTNLDSSPVGLREGGACCPVVASALELPFADNSFDVVLASQMTHHLADEEVVRHLREAGRVTREALMVSDLHRNAGLYVILWLCTRLLGVSSEARADALVSVKRGFQLQQLRELAGRAGLRNPKVWLFYGTRIVLQARKRG